MRAGIAWCCWLTLQLRGGGAELAGPRSAGGANIGGVALRRCTELTANMRTKSCQHARCWPRRHYSVCFILQRCQDGGAGQEPPRVAPVVVRIVCLEYSIGERVPFPLAELAWTAARCCGSKLTSVLPATAALGYFRTSRFPVVALRSMLLGK